MKYYLHDSNSFNDEKITELFLEFGYEGLGLFYTLLEKIAAQEKPIKTTVLKSQLKVGKKLEKCWNYMEQIGLIHSKNSETFNKELLNYSEKYAIKKEKNAKRISEWRINQAITNNVTCNEPACNTTKVNRSKVNRNKKINNKSDSPILTSNEKFLETISNEWKPIVTTWLNYKIEKGQPYKGTTALNTMFDKLIKYSNNVPARAVEIIEFSISNNYSGFFKMKNDTGHAVVLHQSENQVINF